jgi:hypothetical protein
MKSATALDFDQIAVHTIAIIEKAAESMENLNQHLIQGNIASITKDGKPQFLPSRTREMNRYNSDGASIQASLASLGQSITNLISISHINNVMDGIDDIKILMDKLMNDDFIESLVGNKIVSKAKNRK